MTDILIRPVRQQEIDRLQQIAKVTFADAFGPENNAADMDHYLATHLSREKLMQEMANPDSRFFFAEMQEQPIGYLKLNTGQAQTERRLDNALEVERIYVLAEYRGQNIGQFMFDQAVFIARSEGFDWLWLGVWDENPGAIRFYQRNGLTIFGEHSFLLGSDLQTDLLMKVRL